jgi:hypothetical protein
MKPFMQNKKTVFRAILLILILIFSCLGWLGVDRVVATQQGRDWVGPIVWFSLAIPLACLVSIVSDRRPWVFLAAGFLFLPSLFLAWSAGHPALLLLSTLLALAGLRRMREDVDSRIRIRLNKSLHLGMFLMVAACSLAVSSHYYARVRELPLEDLLPRFEMGDASGKLFMRTLASFNPQLEQVDRQDFTIDDLILAFQSDPSGGPSDQDILKASGMRPDDPAAKAQLLKFRKEMAASGAAELQKELLLKEGRRQFSEIVGRDLTGNERAFDVFSEMINRKMTAYFAPSASDGLPVPALPFVLASLLFLTLLSLGSLLQWVWILLAALLFFLSVRLGAVTIKKTAVEKEVLD